MRPPTCHREIIFLDDRTLQADCGPMRLTIQALTNRRPRLDLCRRAAGIAFTYLERIAACRVPLCQPPRQITFRTDDRLARQMINSARSTGDKNLTPMAAVAGTIADAVADWIRDRGASKVVVNNGGDIAIRLAGDESATVGIRTDIRRPDITHVLELNGTRPAWGVATSGFGGRSFTTGIASAVTVVADRASTADAAATAVANACTVADAAIIRQPARQLDPATDIPDIDVTVAIGPLSRKKKQTALNRALEKTQMLVRKKQIIGALLAIDGENAAEFGLQPFLRPPRNAPPEPHRCPADAPAFANHP